MHTNQQLNKGYHMTTITNTEYSEQKVLRRAACQGVFTVLPSDNQKKEKVATALSLVESGFLVHKPECAGEQASSFIITNAGKEHLKILNGHAPKHNNTKGNEVDAKTSLMETILRKRLHILKSAKNRGLEFNLTDANVKSLLNKKVCYYTGVEFDNKDPLNARTFERVDDTKGYVKDNVVAVTLRANRIKNILLEQDSDMRISVESFIHMAEQIKRHSQG